MNTTRTKIAPDALRRYFVPVIWVGVKRTRRRLKNPSFWWLTIIGHMRNIGIGLSREVARAGLPRVGFFIRRLVFKRAWLEYVAQHCLAIFAL